MKCKQECLAMLESRKNTKKQREKITQEENSTKRQGEHFPGYIKQKRQEFANKFDKKWHIKHGEVGGVGG